MEQTSFELTPQQKGMLASLLNETDQPVPMLMAAIAAALEELQERQRLEHARAAPHRPVGDISAPEPLTADQPIWEIADELFGAIPDEELARLPIDGAAQHDHYLYGWPKRSS